MMVSGMLALQRSKRIAAAVLLCLFIDPRNIMTQMVIEIRKSPLSVAIRAAAFALKGINHLLWPAVCVNCLESVSEMDGNLCANCWDQLLHCTGGEYCPRCGREASQFGLVEGNCPDCQGRQIRFNAIARSGIYSQSLQSMILSFKNGKTELDKVLGLLMCSAAQGSGFFSDIDLFVPVPLHWTKRLKRGYNQSLILARKFKHSGAGISTDLVRIRRTKAQPTMPSPAARARNVAGAFAVRRGHKLAGRRICLVDDIKTTGATLNECAKVLKQAGAFKVYAAVLAVAGQNMG